MSEENSIILFILKVIIFLIVGLILGIYYIFKGTQEPIPFNIFNINLKECSFCSNIFPEVVEVCTYCGGGLGE